ncbi:hypothetical protein [Actinomadura soli]|nr:hypothetical protein [Actinomadura soli]
MTVLTVVAAVAPVLAAVIGVVDGRLRQRARRDRPRRAGDE